MSDQYGHPKTITVHSHNVLIVREVAFRNGAKLSFRLLNENEVCLLLYGIVSAYDRYFLPGK